jgi:hypothetical protein
MSNRNGFSGHVFEDGLVRRLDSHVEDSESGAVQKFEELDVQTVHPRLTGPP